MASFSLRRLAGWLTLALLPAAPALAQSYFDEVDIAAGYGRAYMHWPSFQKFLDSYHAANKTDLLSPATLPLASVQSVSINCFNFASVRYEQLSADCRTDFTDVQRNFQLRQRLFLVAVEPAWRPRHFLIGPTFGIGAGECRIGTFTRQPDGTESWGRERLINGSYSSTIFSGFAGLRLGYQWRYAQLIVRGEWVGSGGTTVSLDDALPGDTNNSLPLDYADFLANPPTGVGARVYDSVTPDLTSYRVSLQLGLRINSGSD